MRSTTLGVAGALILLLAACGKSPVEGAKVSERIAISPQPMAATAPPAAQPASEEPSAEPEAATNPDQQLAERVKRALEDDAKIQAAAIDVTAAHGVVSLWGTVASAEEHRRAAKAARAVRGVRSIDNHLAIVRGS